MKDFFIIFFWGGGGGGGGGQSRCELRSEVFVKIQKYIFFNWGEGGGVMVVDVNKVNKEVKFL